MDVGVYVQEAIRGYQQGLINLSELANELRKLEQIREIQYAHNRELWRLRDNLSQWLIDKVEHEE